MLGSKKQQITNQLKQIVDQCQNQQQQNVHCRTYKQLLGQNLHRQFPRNGRNQQIDESIQKTPLINEVYQNSCFTPMTNKLFYDNTFSSTLWSKNFSYDDQRNQKNKDNKFLKNLYIQKTKDLKTNPNEKQQAVFIKKMNQLIFSNEFITIGCDFGPNCMRQVCPFLLRNSTKKLILDKNPIADQGVMMLSKIILKIPLIQLSLISINMTAKGGSKLIAALIGHRSLKKINLSSNEGLNRNRFGKNNGQNLQNVLKHEVNIINNINFNNSNIGQQGFMAICNGYNYKKQQNKNFTEQILNLSIAQNDIKLRGVQHFCKKMSIIPLLKLNISHNNIGDEGFKILGNILGYCINKCIIGSYLKILNVSKNNITSNGLEAFCRSMNNNQILQELYMNENNLSFGQKFFNFKYFISRNWGLKKLAFKNSLNSQDIHNLCQGLCENKSVQALNLNNNLLDCDSFISICTMLSQNKSLKYLYLESCQIANIFLIKSQLLLKKAIYIEQINLQNNYISQQGGKVLNKFLGQNNRITKLNLQKNCISFGQMQSINRLLNDNKQLFRQKQPNLSYYDYVDSKHQKKIKQLEKKIRFLKETQQKMKNNKIIVEIAEQHLQIQKMKLQIDSETKQIQLLKQKIEEKDAKSQNKDQLGFITQNKHQLI